MNGILNVYKEQGFTSFDVVAKLRGITHMKKIGHTGTLDPMAVGVLPVCFGTATKLCEFLTDHEKVYETVLYLGRETDSQDATGEIVKETPVTVSEEEIRSIVSGFVGTYEQMPPMYSAKQVDGVRLYDLARRGKSVERKAVPVFIRSIDILSLELPRVRMRVTCGKGTYIRTLCADIGEKCGCGGMMEELTRIRVGVFDISSALTFEQIEELVARGEFEDVLIKPDMAFTNAVSLTVPEQFDKAVSNGNPLKLGELRECGIELKAVLEGMFGCSESVTERGMAEGCVAEGRADDRKTTELRVSKNDMSETRTPVDIISLGGRPKIRIYDHSGKFMGIYEYEKERRRIRPFKMFLEAENN